MMIQIFIISNISLKILERIQKNLIFKLYQSEVDHPMSTMYRVSATLDSNPMMPGIQTAYMTHALTTKTQGAKLKNSFDVDNHTITAGLDYSKRNWDGGYYRNDIPLNPSMGMRPFHSIWDADTTNAAFFLKDKITMDKFT